MYGSYTLVQYTKLLSDFIHVHTFGFQNYVSYTVHTLWVSKFQNIFGEVFPQISNGNRILSFLEGLKGLATLASGCHSGKFSVCVHIWV